MEGGAARRWGEVGGRDTCFSEASSLFAMSSLSISTSRSTPKLSCALLWSNASRAICCSSCHVTCAAQSTLVNAPTTGRRGKEGEGRGEWLEIESEGGKGGGGEWLEVSCQGCDGLGWGTRRAEKRRRSEVRSEGCGSEEGECGQPHTQLAPSLLTPHSLQVDGGERDGEGWD